MENRGVLLANDVRRDRLGPLVANLARLGVTNVVTACMDGRKLPAASGGFHRVLLDAPCTGLGVISRDPSIKTQKNREDVTRQSHLQKQLILAAIDALDHTSPSGGILVYSTCSIAVEENEAVVAYALRNRHVKLLPLFPPGQADVGRPGLTAHDHGSFHPSLSLSRRFYPHEHNMDGFFVAKLRKLSSGPGSDGARAARGGSAMEEEAAAEGGEEGGEGAAGGTGSASQAAARPRGKAAVRRGSKKGDDSDGEESDSGRRPAPPARVVSKGSLAPGAASLRRPAPRQKPVGSKRLQARRPKAAAAAGAAAQAPSPAAPPAPAKALSKASSADAALSKAPVLSKAPAQIKAPAQAPPQNKSPAQAPPQAGKRKRLPAETASAGERSLVEGAAAAAAAAAAAPAPAPLAAEPAREVVSFLRPGENAFKKKRKAGKKVAEARERARDAGPGKAGKPSTGQGAPGKGAAGAPGKVAAGAPGKGAGRPGGARGGGAGSGAAAR